MAIDVNSGEVLHAIGADELRHPASLTKMMTLYIVFGLIESGRLTLTDRVLISAQAAAQPPSKLGLEVGQDIAVGDAIRALVVKSANDIAVAVAERVSGSEAAFARLMTQKAREIGMPRTVFRNASGLPAAEQVTTARDMLTLAIRLQEDFPKQFQYFSAKSFTHRGKGYRSHNTLVGRLRGVDGIKTGYIRASGFNVVTSLKTDGKSIVAVVFGGSTASARNAQMKALLARILPKATTRRTRKPQLIASPRPAERERLAPVQVPARKSPPTAAEPLRPVLVEPVAVGRADPVAPIPIARVRRVDVAAAAPLGRQPGFAPSPAEATAPTGDAQAAPAKAPLPPEPVSVPADVPPSEEAFHARRPSSLQDQLAQLLAASQDATPPAGPAPGAPARGALPQRSLLNGPGGNPQRNSGLDAAAGYQIQVGAFSSEAEARNQLDKVAAANEPLLSGYGRQTPAFARGSSTIYRARFAGFEAAAATETCLELRRRAIDCFVTR